MEVTPPVPGYPEGESTENVGHQQSSFLSTSVSLSEASTNEDSSVNESPEKGVTFASEDSLGEGGQFGKSSISVIFRDWIPAKEGMESELDQQSEFKPTVGGRPRYFQLHKGHGKIRPGLGSNPEELLKRSRSKSKKRKTSPMELLGDAENFAKRFKITHEKPACAILNEIVPNLQYIFQDCKMEGLKSATPSFTCTVVFPPDGGCEFIGEGRSKKLAKNDVAEKILSSLGVHIPPKLEAMDEHASSISPETQQKRMDNVFGNYMIPPSLKPGVPFQNMHYQQENMSADIDFASDDIININFAPPTISVLSQPMVDSNVLRRLRNIPNFEENICLALNTILIPNPAVYESLGEEGPSHDKSFTVKVSFNGQEFVGRGGSKKKAKANAAKQGVITLLGEDCYKTMLENSLQISIPACAKNLNLKAVQNKGKKTSQNQVVTLESLIGLSEGTSPMEEDEDDGDDWGEYDLNFSDHISNVVREKYEELIGTDSNYSSFKVLAGVVMTTGSPMIYNSTAIAVTTGTKCIEGDCMSEQGLAVNDCHAEILATRCVRDFLYSQIEMLVNAKSDKERLECILEESTEPGSNFKYQLKSDVKFHLYISTSPCGDARIFSPKGIEIDEDQPSPTNVEDSHPNRLNRGVLRSKVESGEGTIPAANLYKGPQTWDSIVSGNALYTMSCSDKVCRWNVLGLQGALLYNFVGSVYYSSITLGSLHHPVHFKRAAYGRVESLNSRLEIPFHVSKPKLMMVSREEKRRVKKSPNHAVCWALNWSTPEILAASKGRCEPGGVASRLTKRMAFTRFLKLYNNVNGKRENYADLSYHEAKELATQYQKAKDEFTKFFMESNLGPWIGKPLEQDSFKIN